MPLQAPRPGDQVAFLDDVGGGVVLRNSRPGHVVVRTDDGFEMELAVKALVPRVQDDAGNPYRVSDHQAGMVAANDLLGHRKTKRSDPRPGKTPKKPDDQGVAEVDLHLHEIVDDETRLSEGERLEFQVRYFERALEAAIRDGKRKLIVVHGVGEGILREEVRKILRFYPGVQFHDADMRRYGSGAAEVLIMRHR